MKRITCKGGPLDGKTYDVPAGVNTFTTIFGQPLGGTYRAKGKTATWTPDKGGTSAEASD